ncbi:MAG: hypothetical protein RR595_05675 [Lysinibacillus sp.]
MYQTTIFDFLQKESSEQVLNDLKEIINAHGYSNYLSDNAKICLVHVFRLNRWEPGTSQVSLCIYINDEMVDLNIRKNTSSIELFISEIKTSEHPYFQESLRNLFNDKFASKPLYTLAYRSLDTVINKYNQLFCN